MPPGSRDEPDGFKLNRIIHLKRLWKGEKDEKIS